MMNKLLGKKVRFNKIIKKHRNNRGCEWIEEDTESQEGVIVGKRVVATGEYLGNTSPGGVRIFTSSRKHTVYIISRNMNTRFIHIPISAIQINNESDTWGD